MKGVNAMTHDEQYDTTVLSDDYSEYRDTVVDQVIAFDPSLFQGAQGEMAQQAQRPTWVSAGSAAMAQAQAAPSPAAQPASRPAQAQPQPQPQSQPVWTQAAPASSIPTGYNPEEDTWVLGTPQPGAAPVMQSASAATMAAAPSYAPMPAASPASSAWQAAPRTTPTMMAAADSKPAQTNPLLIGVIIGLAIVGVVAIVVALAFAFGPKESSKPAASAASASAPAAVVAPVDSSSSSASSAGSTGANEQSSASSDSGKSDDTTYKQGPGSPAIVNDGNGRASTEADFYDKLTGFYDRAGSLDTDVRQCAEDFNNYYATEDKSVRSAKSSAASSLKSKIKGEWDNLKSLEPPFMSKNTDAYDQLCELYECLWHRIDVIDQAWKISLQFEKPKDHESEILKPIRDQQSNGSDRYYTRFNELYPNIKLVKP